MSPKPFVVRWTDAGRERLSPQPYERGFPTEYDALDFVEQLLKERDEIRKDKKNTFLATKWIELHTPNDVISGDELYRRAKRIRD